MNIRDELSRKKFKNDEAFKFISKNYVTLNADEKMINNQILTIILAELLPAMAASDKMFKKMSRGCMYGGSYYKRLKVSKPDEYDINLIMNLPINYRYLQVSSNCNPGYIKIKVTDLSQINKKRDNDIWSTLLDEESYLDQNKFRNWMQSVLVKTLNRYNEVSNKFVIQLDGESFIISYRQSNPAFTLQIRRDNGNNLDVDLVPCLMFRDNVLPGFTSHSAATWIAVAKPLSSEEIQSPNLLWRIGFYKDEKEMLKGQIKPVIRMMKKFRDVRDWPDIKSYYIETVFLHELKKDEFKNQLDYASRTNIFIYMLKRFMEKLRSGKIKNYWHEKHNLLEKIDKNRLQSIVHQLEKIIDDIENNIEEDNHFIIQYFIDN